MKQKVVTMNISLPASLRGALEKKLERHSYSTASEYVRELIRKDLQREQLRLCGPHRSSIRNYALRFERNETRRPCADVRPSRLQLAIMFAVNAQQDEALRRRRLLLRPNAASYEKCVAHKSRLTTRRS